MRISSVLHIVIVVVMAVFAISTSSTFAADLLSKKVCPRPVIPKQGILVEYREEIQYGWKKMGCEPNFAERYTLFYWGVGTEALFGVIVDVEDGTTFGLPPARWNYDFSTSSSILLIDFVVPDFVDSAVRDIFWMYRSRLHWDEFQWKEVPYPAQEWRAVAFYVTDGHPGVFYSEAKSPYEEEAVYLVWQACQDILGECLKGAVAPDVTSGQIDIWDCSDGNPTLDDIGSIGFAFGDEFRYFDDRVESWGGINTDKCRMVASF